ncbi:MAG: hypothetical protein HON04_12395 [Planctomicrobium sp.]|nr:hypothetical protein [Planctomicrobium sp.]
MGNLTRTGRVMNVKLKRFLKLTLFFCVASFLIFMTSKIMLRPERVSEKLMRLGGRIIKKATMNTAEVAIFSGIIIFFLWAVIAAISWKENRQPKGS